MTYSEAIADLLEEGFPAIGHGCNMAGSMAGGIARQERDRWPDLYEDYAQQCRRELFNLGSFHAFVADDVVVYNLATQVRPGSDARLDAIQSAVGAALRDASQRGISQLALPRIGAGIGGLAWTDVRAVLRDLGRDTSIDLVVCTLPRHRRGLPIADRSSPE